MSVRGFGKVFESRVKMRRRKEGWVYRSIAQTRGETRPEAQAAAAKSDNTRHGRFFVFQS